MFCSRNSDPAGCGHMPRVRTLENPPTQIFHLCRDMLRHGVGTQSKIMVPWKRGRLTYLGPCIPLMESNRQVGGSLSE